MVQDLGFIKPGRTVRIPFNTFDKDDGSSITMTNYAVADILIYKDGSTTERASTSGFTATTDFDSKTGKHVLIIDLADNTTADFFAAGSEYLVGIDAVTVDAVTTGGWVARFRIGYDAAILNTTIATLSSQTSFTLTEGPAEDDALNNLWVIIHDAASAVQVGWAIIADYTGSTKTVTLAAATTFTVAAKDNISIMGPAPLQPTVAGSKQVVQTGDSYAIVNSGTHGNAALKTLIDTIDDFLDTEVAAIKAKTDNLPSDPADASDIAGAFATVNSSLSTLATAVDAIDNYVDTEIASIISSIASLPSAAGIADAVWDEAIAGHLSAGSTGLALNAAGSAGDPWSTALPGAYGAGTAGKIIGDNINATISSRASQTSLDTVDDFLDTEIAAIKAKTDNLPADPADASDIAASFSTLSAAVDVIDNFLDTEIAAIKTKTDQLTFTNTNVVDASLQSVGDVTDAVINKFAAIIFRIAMASVEAHASGATLNKNSLYGLIQQAQKSDTTTNAGKQTIFKTDGTTELGQLDLTTDAAAEPITEIS